MFHIVVIASIARSASTAPTPQLLHLPIPIPIPTTLQRAPPEPRIYPRPPPPPGSYLPITPRHSHASPAASTASPTSSAGQHSTAYHIPAYFAPRMRTRLTLAQHSQYHGISRTRRCEFVLRPTSRFTFTQPSTAYLISRYTPNRIHVEAQPHVRIGAESTKLVCSPAATI